MRPTSEDREEADVTRPAVVSRTSAGWVWWGLLAAFTVVMAFSVLWAVRSGNEGSGVNRGPADEAAPGAEPARDIDRSKQP